MAETTSRRTGLLPFARTAEEIAVAACRPLDDHGRRALAELDYPVRLFRVSPFQLQAAQDRVWPGDNTQRLHSGAVLVGRAHHLRLGRLLVDAGLLDKKHLYEALDHQITSGGRLGEILIHANLASRWTVAQVIALQHHLALVNLMERTNDALTLHRGDSRLFHTMSIAFWRDHLLVPVALHGEQLTVAMVNPDDGQAVQQLWAATGWEIRREVTRARDIFAMLQQIYGPDFAQESQSGLLRMRPADSAAAPASRTQRRWLIALAGAGLMGLVAWPLLTGLALTILVEALFAGYILCLLSLVGRLDAIAPAIEVSAERLAPLNRRELPMYTILAPASGEIRNLSTLARALSELDYPADRLDAKLLLNAADTALIDAAHAARLPSFIEIVLVPDTSPWTKANACNYGLQFARGDYTVVFDVEDIPEPDQLLKALAAFRAGGPRLACVQAKVLYFNYRRSPLTRCQAAQHVLWFDLVLPALRAARVPIPLGDGSYHVRTQVLRELGAWDPHNAAGGADLGLRLAKSGYQTEIIDSTTYENASSCSPIRLRQRSDRILGYMQTWLVHMRQPVVLYRSLGSFGFFGFQILIGATPMILLLHPFYALVALVWCLAQVGILHVSFPAWFSMLSITNLIIGSFAFSYATMVAAARRHAWDLVIWSMLAPLYGALLSLAAGSALVRLVAHRALHKTSRLDPIPTPILAGRQRSA